MGKLVWKNWFCRNRLSFETFFKQVSMPVCVQGVGFRDILTGSIWCRKTLRVTGAKLSRGENACHFAWQGQDSVQILCVASAVFPTVHCKFHTLHLTLCTEHSTLLHFRLDNPLSFCSYAPPHSAFQFAGRWHGNRENSPPLFELCFSQKYPKCSPWLHSGSWVAFRFMKVGNLVTFPITRRMRAWNSPWHTPHTLAVQFWRPMTRHHSWGYVILVSIGLDWIRCDWFGLDWGGITHHLRQ